MIDHVALRVSNYERSKAFYLQALAPLGYALTMEFEHDGAKIGGFGADGKTDWWIVGAGPASTAAHLALTAKDHASVRAFFEKALAAGGRDNGAPGPRAHYHPNYFGAFVLDPDGNNIEAVCHVPQ